MEITDHPFRAARCVSTFAGHRNQIADSLLGLFTTYSRHGLKTQAEQVKQRLSTHFPSPAAIGGMARNNEPMTIRATTRAAPSTLDLTTVLDIDVAARPQHRS